MKHFVLSRTSLCAKYFLWINVADNSLKFAKKCRHKKNKDKLCKLKNIIIYNAYKSSKN